MKQNPSHQLVARAEEKPNQLPSTTKKNQSHPSNKDLNNSAHHLKISLQLITKHFPPNVHHHSNTQLQEEETVHMQDMEEEGEEDKDEAEEDQFN